MADDFNIDEGSNPLLPLIQNLVFEENLSKRLNALDIILGSIDTETGKIVGCVAFKRYLRQNYITNLKFMRKLRLYSKIQENIETSIEYCGDDFISHPEYIFDDDFEKSAKKLELLMNNFIGRLLKYYTKTDIIEF